MNNKQPVPLELSGDDLRDLLDILHMADVIMTGHRKAEDPRTVRHRALIRKLYAMASRNGFEELIGQREPGGYAPTARFEQTTAAHPVLDDFGEHLFWDELIEKLSERDAVQVAGGIDHLNAMNDNDRRRLLTPIRQRYIGEFERNGVQNVEVVERFVGEGEPVRTSD